MRPQVKAFRNAAAQVCRKRGFSFKEFMEGRGLEDVLNDAEAGDWSARDLAGGVLVRCCVTGGKFNQFFVGLLAVITFLNDQFGSLGKGEQQAFQDLVKILNTQGTPEAVSGWLKSHYPDR